MHRDREPGRRSQGLLLARRKPRGLFQHRFSVRKKENLLDQVRDLPQAGRDLRPVSAQGRQDRHLRNPGPEQVDHRRWTAPQHLPDHREHHRVHQDRRQGIQGRGSIRGNHQ